MVTRSAWMPGPPTSTRVPCTRTWFCTEYPMAPATGASGRLARQGWSAAPTTTDRPLPSKRLASLCRDTDPPRLARTSSRPLPDTAMLLPAPWVSRSWVRASGRLAGVTLPSSAPLGSMVTWPLFTSSTRVPSVSLVLPFSARVAALISPPPPTCTAPRLSGRRRLASPASLPADSLTAPLVLIDRLPPQRLPAFRASMDAASSVSGTVPAAVAAPPSTMAPVVVRREAMATVPSAVMDCTVSAPPSTRLAPAATSRSLRLDKASSPWVDSRPLTTRVTPVWVLLSPCRVSVLSALLPHCSSAPLPLMGWAMRTASTRRDCSTPSTTKLLVARAPAVPPSPRASVPSATQVGPVKVLAPVRPKVVSAPRLTMPPKPSITPPKLVLARAPVLRVKAPRSTVPAPARLARLPRLVSPPSTSRVPGCKVSAGRASSRSAPARVRLPPARSMLSAALRPCSRLAPRLVSWPPPRSALAANTPPSSTVRLAVSVPLPSSVPRSWRLSMLSLPLRVRRAPADTLTLLPSARRSAEARRSWPVNTSTVFAADRPARLLLPSAVSTPGPRLARARPPSSA